MRLFPSPKNCIMRGPCVCLKMLHRTNLVLLFGTQSFDFQSLSEQDPWSFKINSCQIFSLDLENILTNYQSIKSRILLCGRSSGTVAKSLVFVKTLQSHKTQKQIIVSWILLKNERWGNFQYIKLPLRSFFGRIQNNIFFFSRFSDLQLYISAF